MRAGCVVQPAVSRTIPLGYGLLRSSLRLQHAHCLTGESPDVDPARIAERVAQPHAWPIPQQATADSPQNKGAEILTDGIRAIAGPVRMVGGVEIARFCLRKPAFRNRRPAH